MNIGLSRQLAVLAYLSANSSSLRELASHFSMKVPQMREVLSELNVVEINESGGVYSPFFVDVPSDDGEPVRLIEGEIHAPALSLAEVMSVVALIDGLLEVADEATAANLLTLRERLVAGAVDAGYESALWPAPVRHALPEVMAQLARAKQMKKRVRLEYWVSDGVRARPKEYDAGVIDVIGGSTPYVTADVGDSSLRFFRVDRVGRVEVTNTKFSGRDAKAATRNSSVQENPYGPSSAIVVSSKARWVAESLPVESVEGADPLVVTLNARDFWLGTLLVRLGEDLVASSSEAAKANLERILRAYEEGQ
ncbi:WYL domain-containing protein [Arcanobacterium wilhelmae]|uniref:helix-turn-helix transcriptional regulator n=1 Tax=Arcanobacterium wilhelmae TaxID=1803177 RepID=UPI0024151830|nr:WYL domain-containing protein [Arcanobacterium wilhelmae]WFN89516.1 WYL domain-containing protein [Arcanobacterium wilhelmae]